MPTPTTDHAEHLSTTDAPESSSAAENAPHARRPEKAAQTSIVRHTRGIEDPSSRRGTEIRQRETHLTSTMIIGLRC